MRSSLTTSLAVAVPPLPGLPSARPDRYNAFEWRLSGGRCQSDRCREAFQDSSRTPWSLPRMLNEIAGYSRPPRVYQTPSSLPRW